MRYLDHNATTPLAPEVRAEMESAFECFGNPSSLHAAGQEARRILDRARARVATLLGAEPDEIVFTSGGTEADNLAILGVMGASPRPGSAVVASAVEHPAVLNPCLRLQAAGHPAAFVAVDTNGTIRMEAFEEALRQGPALVSVMLANNDTGTIQPVGTLAACSRHRGAVFHTDAVQAVGKIPVDVRALGVDLLSLSAHKLYGPKGIGALFVRRGTSLASLVHGGHQERGIRPGTENVPAIAGFGKACEVAGMRLSAESARQASLRDAFEAAATAAIPGVRVNGKDAPRLPNTSNVSFEGIDGGALAVRLDLAGIAVSTGAACSATDRESSRVLVAMGRSPAESRSAIRVSFGRGTGTADAERLIDALVLEVAALRGSRRAGA